jgi:RecB family exonuclease
LRGTVLHKIFETYLKAGVSPDGPGAEAALLNVAAQILEQECPWPTTRHIWQAKVERFAAWFLETEIERQAKGTPFLLEKTGSASMTDPLFTLTAKADRIDVSAEGDALIYDYKTGSPPSEKEQKTFEKQLLLEAAIVDQGGFEGLETARTLTATYIGLTPQVLVPAPLEDVPTAVVWDELRVLMQRWADHSRGYTARMTPKLMKYASDYDHLSRYGEWDDTTEITPEDLS